MISFFKRHKASHAFSTRLPPKPATFLNTHAPLLFFALVFTVFFNVTFFKKLLALYALPQNLGFVISVTLCLFFVHALLLGLVCWGWARKWLLGGLIVVGGFSAYYMDNFRVVIDQIMLVNAVQTNPAEAADLLTWRLLLYVIFLVMLPIGLLIKTPWPLATFVRGLKHRLVYLLLCLLAFVLSVLPAYSHYPSFLRQHKMVRFYSNPVTPIYSAVQFARHLIPKATVIARVLDHNPKADQNEGHRELVILVLGETARADRFSLNGYKRYTNPLLSNEPNVISLPNLSSCGTSTAVSVPCMFSALPREAFSDEAFKAEENVIDVLARAGVNVLWRDNNSDSKGVMSRFTIENYKEPALNSVCDVECRDEGMLVGLQKYIDSHPKGDILIVLHAMGSHGPAYSKRYPKAFEQFKPACDTVQLEQCDKASIDNAYDNTILYTDYFLSETIALLKANSPKFEASMIYMSDHGESLGENGLYLHGLPYAFAPKEQKNPAALVWFSDGALADNTEAKKFETLKKQASHPYTHDNLFHSLLGLFEVQTSVYRPELDVFDARSSAAP